MDTALGCPKRLTDFVVAMTALVDNPPTDERRLLEQAGNLLTELVAQDDWLPETTAHSHPEHYQQHLLFCDPQERFCVVSFVWGPGQRTPVHDHTVWGIIGVLRGAECSQRYTLDADGGLVPTGAEERLDPGQLDYVSPDVGDIHRVRNAFDDRVSISIHLYGANIGHVRRHVYTTGTCARKEFVSGYSSEWLPALGTSFE
jgi:predicted metal-dependent enzyme (double-stranded beta helix superfamily)